MARKCAESAQKVCKKLNLKKIIQKKWCKRLLDRPESVKKIIRLQLRRLVAVSFAFKADV